MISAWAASNQVILGQFETKEKSLDIAFREDESRIRKGSAPDFIFPIYSITLYMKASIRKR